MMSPEQMQIIINKLKSEVFELKQKLIAFTKDPSLAANFTLTLEEEKAPEELIESSPVVVEMQDDAPSDIPVPQIGIR